MPRAIASIAALLFVGACASGPVTPRVSTAPAAPSAEFRAPPIMRGADSNGIIGQSAAALMSEFGMARIDLTEGDARKLQFVSATCVLDIFLYPLEAGREPVATHIETRLRRGGMRTERASCVAEVKEGTR